MSQTRPTHERRSEVRRPRRPGQGLAVRCRDGQLDHMLGVGDLGAEPEGGPQCDGVGAEVVIGTGGQLHGAVGALVVTPEVAARLLLEFNFHEYCAGVAGVGDVVRGASTASIGRPGVLRHFTGGAFRVDDSEPPACHGHNDVVILVDVRASGVTRPIERPSGDADLLIVDNRVAFAALMSGFPRRRPGRRRQELRCSWTLRYVVRRFRSSRKDGQAWQPGRAA